MKKVLFVCTGNTCRSSMAEGIFKHLLEKQGIADRYHVMSAGTSVFMETKASENAIKALEEIGIDITMHTSKMLTKEMIEEADIVLTMTKSHKNAVLRLDPKAEGKVFTISEYCNGNDCKDISDPFGGDICVYRQCRDEIKSNLEKLSGKLIDKNAGI